MGEIKLRGLLFNNLLQVNKKNIKYSYYKIFKQNQSGHYSFNSITLILLDSFEAPSHIHPLFSTIHPNSYCINLGTQIGR